MAGRNSLTSVFCVVCIFIVILDLRIFATDSSIVGTCDSEESEEGFCDSADENKYLENVEFHESKLEGNEAAKTSFEDPAKVEISRNEVNDSLTESRDKQIHFIDNSTNEWLGLQIPVVDGVQVSVVLLVTGYFARHGTANSPTLKLSCSYEEE